MINQVNPSQYLQMAGLGAGIGNVNPILLAQTQYPQIPLVQSDNPYQAFAGAANTVVNALQQRRQAAFLQQLLQQQAEQARVDKEQEQQYKIQEAIAKAELDIQKELRIAEGKDELSRKSVREKLNENVDAITEAYPMVTRPQAAAMLIDSPVLREFMTPGLKAALLRTYKVPANPQTSADVNNYRLITGQDPTTPSEIAKQEADTTTAQAEAANAPAYFGARASEGQTNAAYAPILKGQQVQQGDINIQTGQARLPGIQSEAEQARRQGVFNESVAALTANFTRSQGTDRPMSLLEYTGALAQLQPLIGKSPIDAFKTTFGDKEASKQYQNFLGRLGDLQAQPSSSSATPPTPQMPQGPTRPAPQPAFGRVNPGSFGASPMPTLKGGAMGAGMMGLPSAGSAPRFQGMLPTSPMPQAGGLSGLLPQAAQNQTGFMMLDRLLGR